ncbi:hypothetical protein ACM66B_005585 [Microbotryomycetes sp. NB124-2]
MWSFALHVSQAVQRTRLIASHLSSPQSQRTMAFTTVSTPNAPSAVGPYSQAIKTDSLVFVSGCVPLVPETMKVIEGDVQDQTRQALKNLTAVVEASGSSLDKVVKTTSFKAWQVLLDDDNGLRNDFAKVNEIYAGVFPHKPARSCVEVAKLPLGVLVEVECIATL